MLNFFNENWRKYDIVKIDKAGCWVYEVYYLLEIFYNLITFK